jgi:hypothetical protein
MPTAPRTPPFGGGIPCPCGHWHWYELALGTDLAVLERGCPRCRRRALLLLREGRLVGVTPLLGRDLRSVEESVARAHGLTVPEREQVLAVARAVLAPARGVAEPEHKQ